MYSAQQGERGRNTFCNFVKSCTLALPHLSQNISIASYPTRPNLINQITIAPSSNATKPNQIEQTNQTKIDCTPPELSDVRFISNMIFFFYLFYFIIAASNMYPSRRPWTIREAQRALGSSGPKGNADPS